MRKRRIERMTLATLSLAAWVALLGALATGQAHARSAGAEGHALGSTRGDSGPAVLDSVPAMQPHFNPSYPYTVPQSPETPVSPESPGSIFGPGPSSEIQ
jgi:hypothetical protein